MGGAVAKAAFTHEESGTAASALCFNLRVDREGILENIQMLYLIYASCALFASKCAVNHARISEFIGSTRVFNEAERVFYGVNVIECVYVKKPFLFK